MSPPPLVNLWLKSAEALARQSGGGRGGAQRGGAGVVLTNLVFGLTASDTPETDGKTYYFKGSGDKYFIKNACYGKNKDLSPNDLNGLNEALHVYILLCVLAWKVMSKGDSYIVKNIAVVYEQFNRDTICYADAKGSRLERAKAIVRS